MKMLEKPTGMVDAVLDTDTFNEIDDQFALSYMIRSDDKINTKAVYAAPFFNFHSTSPADGMLKSYDEIKKLLGLLGREDVPVFKGSETYLTDEKTPVESDAARNLAELAMNYSSDNPLYVFSIGCITNVASAILMKPEIIEKMVVVWLGGHSIHWPDTYEFNMQQDFAAARIIFGSGVPLVHFPAKNVVSAFTISEAELQRWFENTTPIADYLAKNTIKEVTYAVGKPWTRVIWDVTTIGWVTGDYILTELMPAPIPEYDGHYSFDSRRHTIRAAYYIKRDDLFRDIVDKLTK